MKVKILPPLGKRLAGLVSVPGGVTLSEAVAAAEQRLETIKERGLREIAANVARVQTIGHNLAVARDAALEAELYAAANALIGVAALFGLAAVGDVAFSLCTLLDRQTGAATWDARAVQLHLESLRLVHDETADPAETQAVVSALRRVVSRIPEQAQ